LAKKSKNLRNFGPSINLNYTIQQIEKELQDAKALKLKKKL
jgi:hypothetical protein